MAEQQIHKDNIFDHPKRLLVGGVAIGIGGFLLYKLGRKIVTGIQKRNTENLADDSPEVRQAMSLRSAMNPSGISWMKSFDTTNTTALFDTSKQIKNLDEVSNAYRKLYDDDLLKDVQNELSASDYQKFLTMVSSNPNKTGGSAPVSFAKKSQMVVAKAEVYLRTSPDATYHEAIYEAFSSHKNIIRKAQVGEFLGYATGRQAYDDKNNVKFIEVGYLVKKDGLPSSMKPYAGKSYTYWVSSSSNYVDIFPFYKNMWQAYPGTQQESSYKKPLDYYSSLTGFFSQAVITKRATQVLNNKMQPIIPVPSQTLLGQYLMTLDTGRVIFIKFRTVDNTERWVKADFVTIKDYSI
ncbi:MAG TPA: hypothetical protein VIH57_07945 [Bacteroidales bacterium]